MKVLLLRLEAPLMAFGGVAIDNIGVTDQLPSASLLTGLLGNALGYQRKDAIRLQALQNRLRYAVRADRRGHALQDFQTAQLAKDDKAWTTRGTPTGRDGGAKTYASPHIRYRQYHADASVMIAIHLEPEANPPTPAECAAALKAPARPLFIGRKPCLPSEPLLVGVVEADSLVDALHQVPLSDAAETKKVWLYEQSQRNGEADLIRLSGRRDWASDVHQGTEYWQRKQWGEST